jgi:CheY-like chemotaxis protein
VARVLLVTGDLLFGSKLDGALRAAGYEVTVAGPAAALECAAAADVLVLDLQADGLDLAALAGSGPRTLGYYSHVDADVRDAALAAGIERAVPRSRMNREAGDLVAGLLAG